MYLCLGMYFSMGPIFSPEKKDFSLENVFFSLCILVCVNVHVHLMSRSMSMYTYISMSVSMDMYMYTSMQSPLEFPLGNGDPGPHDSLEIWVVGFQRLNTCIL